MKNLTDDNALIIILPQIIEFYDDLPHELKQIPKQTENKKEILRAASQAFIENYYQLPVELKQLFIDICKNDNSISYTLPHLISNYDSNHRDLKKILKQYANDKKTAVLVGLFICRSDEYICTGLERIFKKIIDNPVCFEAIQSEIQKNSDEFKNIDNGILELLQKREQINKINSSIKL